jgi:pimeloyl-ACP methyl ester carboxylesterase
MILAGFSAVVLTAGCGFVAVRADLNEAKAEARYPATGQFLTVDGQLIHAHVEGDGPDVVLIHGASGNTRDFTFALTRALARDYRVIAFDRPGLGWSERASGNFGGAFNPRSESPREQARFLQAAADQLGVTRPVVLGHSYGGAVALAWGLERPSDTGALVLVAGVALPWPGRLDPMYRVTSSRIGAATVVPLITAFAPEARVQQAVAGIFAPNPVPPGYLRHVGAGLTLRRESFRANARQVNALRPHMVDMERDYARLTMPVEILHGTADTIVPASIHAEPLARRLPDARLTLLEGIGHMPHHAAPEAVIAAIRRAAGNAR